MLASASDAVPTILCEDLVQDPGALFEPLGFDDWEAHIDPEKDVESAPTPIDDKLEFIANPDEARRFAREFGYLD